MRCQFCFNDVSSKNSIHICLSPQELKQRILLLREKIDNRQTHINTLRQDLNRTQDKLQGEYRHSWEVSNQLHITKDQVSRRNMQIKDLQAQVEYRKQLFVDMLKEKEKQIKDLKAENLKYREVLDVDVLIELDNR